MGNFAKRIKLNKVLLADKQKIENGELPKSTKPLNIKQVRAAAIIDKRTDYIPKADLERVIKVARAHALWLHMTILKQAFRFTSTQLLKFYEELQGVYQYAIDDTSAGTTEDIIRVTVHGSPKEDSGNMGYKDYSVPLFDANGSIYEHYVEKYHSLEKSLSEYKKIQRTFIEFDKCELASMLVLKDYFGFAKVRLSRFIESLRKYFNQATWKLYEEKIQYLEKLCHRDFAEFEIIKGGKGVLWY